MRAPSNNFMQVAEDELMLLFGKALSFVHLSMGCKHHTQPGPWDMILPAIFQMCLAI